MDIKKKVIFLVLAFTLLLISLAFVVQVYDKKVDIMTKKELMVGGSEMIKSTVLMQEDYELPDEVYTFLSPQHEMTKMVSLEKNWIYHVYIELVSPHNCSMNIKIMDIDGGERIYEVFENNMTHDSEYARSFEIPFGAAFSGVYNVTFTVESQDNTNIYIRIEKIIPCLHDKIGLEAINNIIFQEVFAFDKEDNGNSVEYNIDLKEYVMHDIYIGRVSSISGTIAKEKPYLVKTDVSIQDPHKISFSLYSDNEMAGVDDVDKSFFGTSLNGSHSVNITIYCEVEHVNIALIIVEDYQISGNSEETDTMSSTNNIAGSEEGNLNGKMSFDQSKNTTSSEDSPEIIVSLPQELMVGTMIIIGSTMGSLIVALVNHKKRNAMSFKL